MRSTSACFRIGIAATVLILVPVLVGCAEQAATKSESPSICDEPWPDFARWNYEALAKLSIPLDRQQEYPWLFDNGSLLSYRTLTTGKLSDVEMHRASITELLDKVDGAANTGQQLRNDYTDKRERMCGKG